MQLAMSVWFPTLSIDLVRRRRIRRGTARSDEPLVILFEAVRQRQVVACVCERSRALGIDPGVALSTARAALGPVNMIVEPYDVQRARSTLRALAHWCHRFSPSVAEEDLQGLCLDITGCTHLFGGEAGIIEEAERGLAQLGFKARVAIAPTFGAARAIARYGGDTRIVSREALHAVIRELPIKALGVDDGVIDGFAEVNIRTIGGLMDLPRASVASRFGQAALSALDRLLGVAPEFFEPIRPALPPRVEQVFEGPSTSLEGIGLACRTLLDRLCATLAARESGVTEWTTTLKRSDLDPLDVLVRHCAPSRDARHLWRLLAPRLERAHLGFGVEGVTITALRTKRTRHHQQALWSEAGDDERRSLPADRLIDTLVNRLGTGAVLRAELAASHVPERAFVMRDAIAVQTKHAVSAPHEGDRPTRLFDSHGVVGVIALSPDGPVSRVEWRGAVHTIITCIGPERITGAWWDSERLLRDYFKVQDDQGRWLWIYRDHLSGKWFVHGAWE